VEERGETVKTGQFRGLDAHDRKAEKVKVRRKER
jgi:hypothetical protein